MSGSEPLAALGPAAAGAQPRSRSDRGTPRGPVRIDAHATPSAPAEPPDLRLLPVALGLWAGTASVLMVLPPRPLQVSVVSGLLLLVLGGLVLVAKGRAGRVAGRSPESSATPDTGRRQRRTGLVLAPAAALLGLVLGGLHLAGLQPSLVVGLADEAAVVSVVAEVTGDPRAHAPSRPEWSAEPTWTVTLRVTELTHRGRSYRLALPAVGRGAAMADVTHGSRIAFSARASAPWAPQEQALSLQALGPVDVRAPPGALAAATNTVRAAFRSAVAGLPPDAGALLLGLAVGDESTLSAELDAAMVRAGLAHLTAVSGANTSLVVGLVVAAAGAAGLGWRMRAGSGLLVLYLYVTLVRPQPSVLRAAVMGLVALLAMTTGGRRRGPPALCAAVIALLCWLPELALAWGFALSVAATAGLILVAPTLADRMARWQATRWLGASGRAALGVALAAHLATLPIVVGLGSGISWLAVPANIVVAPVVPYATVVGLAAAVLAPLLPGAAAALAWVGAPGTWLIARIAHGAAAAPASVTPVPATPVGMLGTAAVVGLLLLGLARGWPGRLRRRWVVWGVVATLLGAVLGGVAWDRRWPPGEWVVLACDVGQGDALLLRAPGSRHALLVDVGPADAALAGCIRDAGISQVSVVLTHFHADHVDGLAEVLDQVEVDQILTTPVGEPSRAARAVVAAAASRAIPLRTVRAGQDLTVAELRLRVLWPARRTDGPNNASVVLLAGIPAGPPASAGPASAAPADRPPEAAASPDPGAGHDAAPVGGDDLVVLLPGDLEPLGQAALLGVGVPDVDVLKVPHHGSAHQDAALAATARPEIALVTVGADNPYGHPNAGTLAQYAELGARVGRTDTQGSLAVVPGPAGPVLRMQR